MFVYFFFFFLTFNIPKLFAEIIRRIIFVNWFLKIYEVFFHNLFQIFKRFDNYRLLIVAEGRSQNYFITRDTTF